MYDLKALQIFESLLRHGNLSACARDFGMTKSTVSRRLQSLEAQVGQSLMRRETNPMVATEAGRVFEKYCRAILALTEESQESLGALKRTVSGTLTLHVHEGLMRGWFTEEMERFIARHPHIRITLRTQGDSPPSEENDAVCIWLGPLPETNSLQQVPLGRLTRGIYAHPDYLVRHGAPRHPRDLAHHQWIDLLGDSGDGLTLNHPQHGRVSVSLPGSRIQVDRLALQGDAIVRGHGVGILPHWTVAKRSQAHPGTLAPCLPGWQAAPLAVRLLHPSGQLSRRTRAFIDHIRAAVPSDWTEDRPAVHRPAAVQVA